MKLRKNHPVFRAENSRYDL